MTGIYTDPGRTSITVGQGSTRNGLSTLPSVAINASSRDPLLPLPHADGTSTLPLTDSPSTDVGASSSAPSKVSPPGFQPTSEIVRQEQQQALQVHAPQAAPSSHQSVYGQASSRTGPLRLSSTSATTSQPTQPASGGQGRTAGQNSSQEAPASSENGNIRTSKKLGAGSIAGMAVGIVAAVSIAAVLVWVYRRRRSMSAGFRTVKRRSQTSEEQRTSRFPSEGWTEFQAVTPTVEKGPVSPDDGEKPKDRQPIQENLQNCYVPDAGGLESYPSALSPTKRTPYEMFSQYAAILPPPSMRSKRTSAVTNRSAGQASVDTALDSTLCLPYPAPDRPESADLSALVALNRQRSRSLRLSKSQSAPDVTLITGPVPSGITSPARSGSQRKNATRSPARSPISGNFPNTARSSMSAALQAEENLSPTPAYSQRSTMTEISLSAVGIGRAM